MAVQTRSSALAADPAPASPATRTDLDISTTTERTVQVGEAEAVHLGQNVLTNVSVTNFNSSPNVLSSLMPANQTLEADQPSEEGVPEAQGA